MDTIDAAVMWAAVTLLSALAYAAKERIWPSDMSAEDLGYAPGSETPPWGWRIALALGLAACGLLLFGPTLAARIIGL